MHKLLTKVAIAVAAIAGLSNSAHARITIQITDLTLSASVFCDSAVAQVNSVGGNCYGFNAYTLGTNNLTFADDAGLLTVGAFTFDTSKFKATTAPGSTTPSTQLAANNFAFYANDPLAATGEKLRIVTTAYDYTVPAGQFKNLDGTASENLIGSVTGTQQYGFYIDGTNSGLSGNGITCGTVAIGASVGACDQGGIYNIGAPGTQMFSITSVQNFTVTAGTGANNRIQNSTILSINVPEPTSLALVGAALLAAGAAARRRKA